MLFMLIVQVILDGDERSSLGKDRSEQRHHCESAEFILGAFFSIASVANLP